MQQELRVTESLREWTRAELYSVREGAWRAEASLAVAAAAAEETYRITDDLPRWRNGTSESWRLNLQHVWQFLAGDHSQHYALSRAIADFLVSPLNHNEGQDGPDDFDRPQTIAAYSATLCAVAWGVDFAVTAVSQIFEAIDLKYDSDHDAEGRWSDVQQKTDFVRRIVTTVVGSKTADRVGFSPEMITAIRT